MSAPRDPGTAEPDELELVSAYLDGETTAEETARVEGDARLRALADRLGGLAAGLAVDDPPAGLADEQVAAALDHFPAVPADAPVVDLSAERRRRWYDRIPLGAVAAALVIVALIGAVAQLDLGAGDDDTATAGDTADAGGDAGAGSASEQGAALEAEDGDGFTSGGGGEAATEASPRRAFATADELAEHIAVRLLTPARSQATLGSDAEAGAPDDLSERASDAPADYDADVACDAVAAAGVDGAPVLAVVPAILDGRDVTAIVVDDGSARRLVVIDDLACAVVDERAV